MMTVRCEKCGKENNFDASVCASCGASLTPVFQRQLDAMHKLRIFSLIYLVTSVISVSYFAASVIFSQSGYFFNIFSGATFVITQANLVSTLTKIFIFLEIALAVSFIVEIISVYYLRTGFNFLRRDDYEFSSPHTGSTLLLIGLIMAMVGVAAILGLIVPLINSAQTPNQVPNLSIVGGLLVGAFLALIGGVLTLVGVIMGFLMGFHRLSLKYNETMFDLAWIFFLIAMFFAPLGFLAAIFSLEGTNRTIKSLVRKVGIA